jgi:hypothetical protein
MVVSSLLGQSLVFCNQLPFTQDGYAQKAALLSPLYKQMMLMTFAQTKCLSMTPAKHASKLQMPCRRLKQDKVPTVAYVDSFEGMPNGTTLGYYLATAFDQITAQPGGFLCLLGMHTCFVCVVTSL